MGEHDNCDDRQRRAARAEPATVPQSSRGGHSTESGAVVGCRSHIFGFHHPTPDFAPPKDPSQSPATRRFLSLFSPLSFSLVLLAIRLDTPPPRNLTLPLSSPPPPAVAHADRNTDHRRGRTNAIAVLAAARSLARPPVIVSTSESRPAPFAPLGSAGQRWLLQGQHQQFPPSRHAPCATGRGWRPAARAHHTPQRSTRADCMQNPSGA